MPYAPGMLPNPPGAWIFLQAITLLIANVHRKLRPMTGSELTSLVSSFADIKGVIAEPYNTGIAGLAVFRSRKPTSFTASLYEPVICLILQGSKEVHVGAELFTFSQGESVVVTHDVPMVSRIVEASEEAPYLALSLPIDVNEMRTLASEIDEIDIVQEKGKTLKYGKSDPAILDAIGRLFELVDQPAEAKVIAPLTVKEIYIRLLLAPHGAMLRHLLQHGSPASHISNVIAFIKKNYAQPLSVDELAGIATMSSSSFYEYFKAITSTTPFAISKGPQAT